MLKRAELTCRQSDSLLTVDFDSLEGKHDALLDDPKTVKVICNWLAQV